MGCNRFIRVNASDESIGRMGRSPSCLSANIAIPSYKTDHDYLCDYQVVAIPRRIRCNAVQLDFVCRRRSEEEVRQSVMP